MTFVRAPNLSGRSVSLRPVIPADYEYMYGLAVSEELNYRWRFRGVVPPFEQFVDGLLRDALIQFTVVHTRTKAAIGLVTTYATDLRNGHTYVGTIVEPSVIGTGLGIVGTLLFLDYIFDTWPLRKVYFELPEYNIATIGSGIGRYLDEEGRLTGHYYFRDRHWDLLILGLTRETWNREKGRLLAHSRERRPRDV